MSQALKPAVGACAALLLSLASLQAQNTVVGTSSGVGSGNRNLIYNSSYAWIGGGFTNVIVNGANFSTIGGGYSNAITTNGVFAAIGGGSLNQATATNAVVGGGTLNAASGTFSTVSGGGQNTASADYATVGGGWFNTASENFDTVAGGLFNTASGGVSFAGGYNALATNSVSFVWSGSTAGTESTNTNSFTVRAPGGARFLSANTGTTNGVILAANGASWGSLSDSNAKTDIAPVNAREVLKKVAALPVSSWHYKHDLSRRYIGPMAQDFHAAFGLGADDKTITTLDTDGVTLAAIQGLVEELKERDQQLAGLRAENADMRAHLQAIDERLSKLPPSR